MFLRRAWFALLAVPLIVPLALGCSDDEGDDPGGAHDDGGAGGLFEIDGTRITARDAALEQPMLLVRTLRNGPADAAHDAYNPVTSKLVYFRARESTVELRELAAPTADPGDGDRVLASFAAEPADGGVSFAYQPAEAILHVQFAVHDRTDPLPELELPILEQTVDRAELAGGYLVVERELIVDASQIIEGAVEAPAGIMEVFAPYEPPADFEGRENGPALVFYENPPLPGQDASFIHRHDASAPIVFHPSSNTPPARRADLEVAVAYWNRLLADVTGTSERIQLEDLPDGLSDFDPGYNVVRWLDGLSEGGRGVNHTDPFTGRIVQSTIHVSPIFEVAGADAAKVAWGRMLADRGEPAAAPPQELVDRVVSDYYVNAYVHELGHGLGLRHQFAGNLRGTVTSDQADAVIAEYLEGDRGEGVLWASSVMEYVPILSAAMIGDAARDEALPHDVAAIALAHGPAGEPADFGPYCEAQQLETFADCRENDIGSDSIAGTYWTWEDRLEEIAFRNAAASAAGEPLSDPATDALIVSTLFGDAARQLVAGAEFLAVRAEFPDPLPDGEADAYAEALAAHQAAGYAATSGSHRWFLDQILTTGPSAEAAAQLIAELRTRTEELAAALDTEVDPAALDAWAASTEAELAPLLAPLADLDFIDVVP